jgi:hypothetical protein
MADHKNEKAEANTFLSNKVMFFIQFGIFIISLFLYMNGVPGGTAFMVLQLIGFTASFFDVYVLKNNNAFFPKCFFKHKPYWILIVLIIFGAMPTILNGRIIVWQSLHHNIDNIILCPLLIYFLANYIYKIDKKYSVLDTANTKVLAPISSVFLTLIFFYCVFFTAYWPTSSILSPDALIYFTGWINVAYQIIILYFAINCVMLSIYVFKRSDVFKIDQTGNMSDDDAKKLNYSDIFPMGAFITYCILIFMFGISFYFTGHAVEIVLEISWAVNLAIFIPLSYEVRILLKEKNVSDNIKAILSFHELKIRTDHIVIIVSILTALYGIVIRYIGTVAIASKDKVMSPGPEAVGLVIAFALIMIISCLFYFKYRKKAESPNINEADDL